MGTGVAPPLGAPGIDFCEAKIILRLRQTGAAEGSLRIKSVTTHSYLRFLEQLNHENKKVKPNDGLVQLS